MTCKDGTWETKRCGVVTRKCKEFLVSLYIDKDRYIEIDYYEGKLRYHNGRTWVNMHMVVANDKWNIKKMDRKLNFLFNVGQDIDLDKVFCEPEDFSLKKVIVDEARRLLGYSTTTVECDILSSLSKAYDIMVTGNNERGWYTGY